MTERVVTPSRGRSCLGEVEEIWPPVEEMVPSEERIGDRRGRRRTGSTEK
jgi:hypothetical protein